MSTTQDDKTEFVDEVISPNIALKNSIDSLLKVIRGGAKNAKEAKPLFSMVNESNDRLTDLKYKVLELTDDVSELAYKVVDIPEKTAVEMEHYNSKLRVSIRSELENSEDRMENVIELMLKDMEKRQKAEIEKQMFAFKTQIALSIEKTISDALRPGKRLRPSSAAKDEIEEFKDNTEDERGPCKSTRKQLKLEKK
jgi:hypothetical protein